MALIVSRRRILLEAKSKDKGLYWGFRIGRVIPQKEIGSKQLLVRESKQKVKLFTHEWCIEEND